MKQTTLSASAQFGAAVLHLTTKARQSGSGLRDSWFGDWRPKAGFEETLLKWLGVLLLNDRGLTEDTVKEICQFYRIRTLPQICWYVGEHLLRDAYWQARLVLLLCGQIESPDEIRQLGADRALKVAELCAGRGWTYDYAILNDQAA